MLGPKIETLPDDHPSKAQCLYHLSRLFFSAGNYLEYKRLLTHTLKLWREQGDDDQVAQRLRDLSEANRLMRLHEEGIQQAKEALEIFERLGDTVKQAGCLVYLAHALHDDIQLDAAQEVVYRAIDLLPEKGEQFMVCQGHRILGETYNLKGDTEKSIHHFEVALEIASSLNLDRQLFWVHYSLARLFVFSEEGRFDDAQAHIERAKSHAINDVFKLGRAMELQARSWYQQHMYKKAKSEALHAAKAFEKLGAALDLERCRELLRWIDEEPDSEAFPNESEADGELLETSPLPVCINAHIRLGNRMNHCCLGFFRAIPAQFTDALVPLLNYPLRHIPLYNHFPHTSPLLPSTNIFSPSTSIRTCSMFVIPPFAISYDTPVQAPAPRMDLPNVRTR